MGVRPAAAADLRFRDRGVYLDAADAVVVADLHIGRESSAEVEAPLAAADEIRDRVESLRDEFDPETVVFAGDMLHSFGDLSMTARRTVEQLYDDCTDDGVDPVAVAGNHDARLADCWPDTVEDALALADGTVVCHGHEQPETAGERYLIGHDHPALTIEGVRQPCYLYGERQYREADLLVLPAFTRWAGGVECNHRRASDLQSPLVRDLASMQPVVWDGDGEEELWFPRLESIRKQL
jgi:putative SbcD/Mre11-related phosphoesterase